MKKNIFFVAGLIILSMLVFGCAKGPTPDNEGQNWSLEDMSNFLKGKGINFEVKNEVSDSVPILQLFFTENKNGWVVIGKCPSKNYGGNESTFGKFWIFTNSDTPEVIKGYQDITKALRIQ